MLPPRDMEITDEIEATHHAAQDRLAAMGNYHRWILANLEGGLGRRVWDAGAGIGIVTAQLVPRTEFLLATEFTGANLETLRQRFQGSEDVRVEFCDLTTDGAAAYARFELDTIITLDVLEHLEDDRRVLALYHRVLEPGGRLLIKVPAHPFLYGTMDDASLHYRRYTRRGLRAKLQAAGFTVERLRYMNMAAVLPYLLKGRVLRRRTNFSSTIGGSRMGFYNRLIPWLQRLEGVLPPPFGLSLVAIGRKTP